MDGQVTRCAQCGAPVSTGRFCTHCGAPLASAAAPPPAPDLGDTAARERVYAVPDEPAYPPPPPETLATEPRPVEAQPVEAQPVEAQSPEPEPVQQRPLFADDLPAYANPVFAEPTVGEPGYAAPVYAEPAAAPRRSPGAGLWIGAAAGLVLVLVLGAFLLLNGGGSDDDTASTTPTPLIPKATPTKTPPPSTPATSSPATTPTSTPTGALTNAARGSLANAPAHAPAGVDFAGQPVTFVAANMVDGVVETCWRTPGDATGMVLTFRLVQPTTISQVGLINGYAKTAFSNGRRYDWYQGDRRVLGVDWIFDDGSTVSQTFTDARTMQGINVTPVTTSTVKVRITSVSAPGTGPAARDDTAISEVGLVGTTS